MKAVLKIVLLLVITSLMIGCKLAVVVVEGGEVMSTSPIICEGSNVCIFDVEDTSFADTFAALADSGWYFEKWNAGDRFFCAGSSDPLCMLSLVEAEGNVDIEELVASSETFYLMPIFKPSEDMITVNGKQWLQVDLFSNLTWDEINEICPGGPCKDQGFINDRDMTGWMWAAVEDVNSLFNYYLGGEILGPGPDRSYSYDRSPNASPSNDFFSDGWRTTYARIDLFGEWFFIDRGISGWTNGTDFQFPNCFSGLTPSRRCVILPTVIAGSDSSDGLVSFGSTSRSYWSMVTDSTSTGFPGGGETIGAWFYRTL
jgi:hypothetical protein